MNKAVVMLALSQAWCLALAQSADSPISLEPHKAGAATYVCGGVGFDEQQAIKSDARRHDLMLTFAETSGAYLAGVDVQIANAKGGVVLSATCDGPIMLVDLPGGGSWRVTAQVNGQTRQKTISAGPRRPAQATLLWPAGLS
ncbi:MAG TPA: carboxypeptidase regulatory-like domain-containing protein [Ramlibacter sp.]|nr:carboxypeptidase regulatory-like domain-containing protein [Ramlibacter sp.]